LENDRDILLEIKQLRSRLPQVTGVVVASADGLLVAHEADGIEPERMAAMSAAQLGLAQQIARGAGCGDFQDTVTRAADGYVATFAAGACALITVLAEPDLNVGLLHHEAPPVASRAGALYERHDGDEEPTSRRR